MTIAVCRHMNSPRMRRFLWDEVQVLRVDTRTCLIKVSVIPTPSHCTACNGRSPVDAVHKFERLNINNLNKGWQYDSTVGTE